MEAFLIVFGSVGCIFSIGYCIWAWCWDVPEMLRKEKELQKKASEFALRATGK